MEIGHWLCKLVDAVSEDGGEVVVGIGGSVSAVTEGGAGISVTHGERGLWEREMRNEVVGHAVAAGVHEDRGVRGEVVSEDTKSLLSGCALREKGKKVTAGIQVGLKLMEKDV